MVSLLCVFKIKYPLIKLCGTYTVLRKYLKLKEKKLYIVKGESVAF